jgi:hypothetical protein
MVSMKGYVQVIQKVIEDQVPKTRITTKSKRWWTKELTQLRRQADKLGRQAYRRQSEPEHEIHAKHKEAVKRYDKTLSYTKKQHWRDWLEKAEEPDLWTVSKLIAAPATNSGKSRIPILKIKAGDRECYDHGLVGCQLCIPLRPLLTLTAYILTRTATRLPTLTDRLTYAY